MLIGTFTLGDALLTVLEIAFLFFWIWLAISVVLDIFRSHEMSGWAKAAWILTLMVLPLLGVLIYLIVHGDEMREHDDTRRRERDWEVREYIRSAAASPVDDIVKLDDLRNRGVLTEAEFERAKAQALPA
jgi:Phospholipase_D-nuclease N-terminal/Short C-terminal domain